MAMRIKAFSLSPKNLNEWSLDYIFSVNIQRIINNDKSVVNNKIDPLSLVFPHHVDHVWIILKAFVLVRFLHFVWLCHTDNTIYYTTIQE